MPLCKACNAVLPEPNEKAHRRQKFCNTACKQRFYHKHRTKRKRDEHTPFYKEQAEFWQARYEETQKELERERRNGDELEKRLVLLQERMDGLQERREWIEARLSAAEGLLHIEPVSPETERALQQFDDAFRDVMKRLQAELDALARELRDTEYILSAMSEEVDEMSL
jgi:chromosome segregation ATPase